MLHWHNVHKSVCLVGSWPPQSCNSKMSAKPPCCFKQSNGSQLVLSPLLPLAYILCSYVENEFWIRCQIFYIAVNTYSKQGVNSRVSILSKGLTFLFKKIKAGGGFGVKTRFNRREKWLKVDSGSEHNQSVLSLFFSPSLLLPLPPPLLFSEIRKEIKLHGYCPNTSLIIARINWELSQAKILNFHWTLNHGF